MKLVHWPLMGWLLSPPRPLLAVPNVTAHPSTASVPITVMPYSGPLLCSFNVAIKVIMRMDDNADAKRILLASPPADWRRQLGRPCITWLSIVQQDLKQHHLTLPEAADMAQNRPLWRMMSTYGAKQS